MFENQTVKHKQIQKQNPFSSSFAGASSSKTEVKKDENYGKYVVINNFHCKNDKNIFLIDQKQEAWLNFEEKRLISTYQKKSMNCAL